MSLEFLSNRDVSEKSSIEGQISKSKTLSKSSPLLLALSFEKWGWNKSESKRYRQSKRWIVSSSCGQTSVGILWSVEHPGLKSAYRYPLLGNFAQSFLYVRARKWMKSLRETGLVSLLSYREKLGLSDSYHQEDLHLLWCLSFQLCKSVSQPGKQVSSRSQWHSSAYVLEDLLKVNRIGQVPPSV